MEFSPFTIRAARDIRAILQEECHRRKLCEEDIQISLQSRSLTIIQETIIKEATIKEAAPLDSRLDSSAESKLCDEHFYNTSGYKIQQTCELLVRAREHIESFCISLSPARDRAFLHCFDSFIVLEESEEEFCAIVFAKLALLGVILRDLSALSAHLRGVLAHIRATPRAKSKPICILESAQFTPPKPMRFVFLPQSRYEQAHANQPQTLYDNECLRQSPRIEEAFYGVREGELVGVYEFGDLGVAGRDLVGEYICPQDPSKARAKEQIIPTSQPHISFKAYDDRIEYYSQIQGFIALNNQYTAPFASPESKHEHPAHQPSAQATPESKNAESSPESKGQEAASPESKNADIFCFFNTAQLKACKSTNTPPLLGGIEAHIALCIESSDSSIDALGDGVYIEAMSVEISGDLGSETTIKAKHLVLNGASHKSSQILAQRAKILTHRGLLCAQECVVKNLDSGFVYADSAKIQEANASTIYATSIHIERARNANACHFAKELIIDEIPQKRGDDNALIFDITANSAYRDYLARARTHRATKLATLEQTRAWCRLLAPRFQQAERFLSKMQGFTKPQREIALKEPSFAQIFARSRATYKLYKTLLLRESTLKQALEKLELGALELQSRLAHATIRIGHVGGFENYALLRSCQLLLSAQGSHALDPAYPSARTHLPTQARGQIQNEEHLLLQVGKSAQIVIETSEQGDSGAESIPLESRSAKSCTKPSTLDSANQEQQKAPRIRKLHLKAVE